MTAPTQTTPAELEALAAAFEHQATIWQGAIDYSDKWRLAKSHQVAAQRRDQLIAQALRLAAEAAKPVPVAVKPLRWNEYEHEGCIDRWDAEAGSFGVYYGVELHHDGYRSFWDGEAFGPHNTLELAKAAAQADFERRILAALAAPPAASDRFREGIEAAEALIRTAIAETKESYASGEGPRPGILAALECTLDRIRSLAKEG